EAEPAAAAETRPAVDDIPSGAVDTAGPPPPIAGPSRAFAPASRSADEDGEAARRRADAINRLVLEKQALRARIDALDAELRDFDRIPPSQAARRGADPSGRPRILGRQRDQERTILETRERAVDRNLMRLRASPGPLFGGGRSAR
ncbi:MAG: hypothetical protein ACFCUO_13685, partial [Rhodospirillales bacterium]